MLARVLFAVANLLVVRCNSSSRRFVERITETPLLRYVFRCTANLLVFNADLKLSMLIVRSRRESGNKFQTIGGPATENA